MKLSRRLIPAFAMLLVSAVLMSTASFAWFSMRDTVTVNGMQVNAVSDAIFLEIAADGDSLTFGEQASAGIVGNGNGKLHPIAHVAFPETGAAISDIDPTDKQTWYYMYSDDPTSATGKGAQNFIENFEVGDKTYVVTKTFKVRVNSKAAADEAYNLHVSEIKFSEDIQNSGVKIIVAGANGIQEFAPNYAKNNEFVEVETPVTLVNTITSSASDNDEGVEITVYIYIDGTAESVKTETDITKIAATIDFKLKADVTRPST